MRRIAGIAGVVLLGSIVGLSGCGGGEEPVTAQADVPEDALRQARAAADELTAELKQRLLEAMSQGGPVAAIEVCATAAPEIAAAHSVGGIVVRRVSRKARNPEDLPDAWEEGMLVDLESRSEAGDLPEEVWKTVDTPGGEARLRYLRPITVGPMCLNCHGDSSTIPEDVQTKIRELYPEDNAVGYEAGDFRGAVSVTVPLQG